MTVIFHLLCFLFYFFPSSAIKIPGVSPKEYKQYEEVPLTVNKLTSTKTHIPYEYYNLPFCKPDKIKSKKETLGQVLEGEAVATAPYHLKMKVTEGCGVVCRKVYDAKEAKLLRSLIRNEYRGHLLVESLPGAVYEENYAFVSRGYPIGFISETINRDYFLNNHLRFIFYYNEERSPDGTKEHDPVIVGFQVIPMSLNHRYDDDEFVEGTTTLATCNDLYQANPATTLPQSIDGPEEVIFTYDVQWQRSNVKWANRWDIYLKTNPNEGIHIFSIMNSFMIVLFLSGLVGMIMLRTLRRDISNYNVEDIEIQEESGWKVVHGDVFRPPLFSPILLSVLCGSGIQVLVMSVVTLLFSCLGIASPTKRGSLLTALLLLFVFAGSAAGYFSARMYKYFQGKDWKKCMLLTALLFPSVIFAIFFCLDLLLSGLGSSTAVPLQWVLALLLLWFCVSLPLVFIGSYYGFKKPAYEVPIKVTKCPRQLPVTKWHTHPMFQVAVGGLLPFATVSIELFFIMSAMWLHQVYYFFGFLAAVLIIMVLSCAEMTIITIYFQLCSEDYRWWWRSFLTSGSSALYLYVYSMWYFVSKLNITQGVSVILYFSYMLIISLTFFLLTGSVGFYASFWFVRKIYGAIKID